MQGGADLARPRARALWRGHAALLGRIATRTAITPGPSRNLAGIHRPLRHPVASFFCAYAVLVAAWLLANPPSAAPDEPAHYVKAIAAGDLRFLGPRPPVAGNEAMRGFARTARYVSIPVRLDPGPFGCTAFVPSDLPTPCLNAAVPPQSGRTMVTSSGLATYPPFLYVLPGLVMRHAPDRESALYLGRAIFAVLALALLAVALALLRARATDARWLVGPLVALSPMVVFMFSTLSSSSAEIAAGLACAAAALHFGHAERVPNRGFWLLTAGCAVVLALSRPLGPIWILLLAMVAVGLRGCPSAGAAVRAGGRWALGCLALVGATSVVELAWHFVVEPSVGYPSFGALIRTFVGGFDRIPELLTEQIGVFGWLETPMPPVVYTLWQAVLVSVITLAMLVATRRQRWVLGLCVGAWLLSAPAMTALLTSTLGGAAQGRWVLPFTVVVPLLAGDILAQAAVPLTQRSWLRPLVALAALIGAIQLIAFWANAQRYAVGEHGPTWFLPRAAWSPPVGWVAPILAVMLGASAIVLVAWRSRESPTSTNPAPSTL